MAQQALKLQIDVGTDGLIAGLKVATKGVDGAAEQFRGSFKAMSAASGEAKEHVGGLFEKLKEFKGEQVQGARIARFYGNELASLIPAAGGAGGAMRDLLQIGLEGAAGGFGIGLGIEVAVFAFKTLAEHVQEAEKHADELKKAYLGVADGIDKALRKVAEGLKGPVTQTAAAWRGEAEKMRDEVRALQREIDAAVGKAASPGILASLAGTFTPREISGTGSKFQSSTDKDVSKLQEKQAALIQALEDRKKQRDEVAAEEEVKRTRDVATQVLGIRAGMATQEEQVRRSLAVTLRELDKQTDLSDSSRAQLRVAHEAEAAQKIRAIHQARHEQEKAAFKELEEAERSALARRIGAEADKSKILRAYHTMRIEEAATRTQAVEAEAEAFHQKWSAVATTVGSAIGGAFAVMASGAKSFGAAMGTLARTVVGEVIKIAVAWVTADAAKGSASTFASIAAIPIVGPFLAPAAAAAAGGAIMAMLSMIPSASGGWDVPRGTNPVAQIHSGEMVLPEPLADVVRGMAAGGGGGGMTITINAMDGASVQRVVEGPDFRRAMAEARRNGRL